jgi:dCMP deaminase
MTHVTRPSWDEYFMSIAYKAAERANCSRRSVGAIIIKEKNIVSTGYNGTPVGVPNCFDGGCPRCSSDVHSFGSYDICICVHAEQNAMLFAARNGIATLGGTIYSTLKPCLGCLKESIQSGITQIIYDQEYEYPPEIETIYRSLIGSSGLQIKMLGLLKSTRA